MKKLFVFIVLALVLFVVCHNSKGPLPPEKVEIVRSGEGEALSADAVLSKMDEMSIDEKLWQLFFVTPETVCAKGTLTKWEASLNEEALKRPVGGVILFSQNISDRSQVTELIGAMKSAFEIPAFFGVDEEGGKVTRLSKSCGVTDNGAMLYIETAKDAEEIGRRLGTELCGLGFTVDFAPVADVLVDPNNKEIGDRSYGTDPEHVSKMVAAQVRGMEQQGLKAVLKHFPGHASTSANSHKGVSVSERSREQLRRCELLPFKSGIEAGAEFVMVSHMSLPLVTGDETPCSLSSAVIDGQLRSELGYGGIVITDALNMGAVAGYTSIEQCIMAIEAGADMLLMPKDADAAHSGLLAAVESGRISEERINESVERILRVKHSLGMI